MDLISEYLRKLAGVVKEETAVDTMGTPEEEEKPLKTVYHVEDIKIVFSAPDPKGPSSNTLTVEKDLAREANFYWVNYLVLFSVSKGEDSKFYILKMPLNPEGTEKGPNKVYESDSNWSTKNVKSGVVAELDPAEVKLKFPEILKGPDLHPDGQKVVYVNIEKESSLPSQLKKGPTPPYIKKPVPPAPGAPTQAPGAPTTKFSGMQRAARTFSSDEFKRYFDNNFYVVLNPKKPRELKNPFGKLVGLK